MAAVSPSWWQRCPRAGGSDVPTGSAQEQLLPQHTQGRYHARAPTAMAWCMWQTHTAVISVLMASGWTCLPTVAMCVISLFSPPYRSSCGSLLRLCAFPGSPSPEQPRDPQQRSQGRFGWGCRGQLGLFRSPVLAAAQLGPARPQGTPGWPQPVPSTRVSG